MLLQPVCDLGRVLDMAFDAQGEGLQTDTNVEGVGWRDRRPGVAQKRNSCLENIGKVRTEGGVFTQVPCINQTVVTGGRFVELGELFGVGTIVEIAGVHDNAAN